MKEREIAREKEKERETRNSKLETRNFILFRRPWPIKKTVELTFQMIKKQRQNIYNIIKMFKNIFPSALGAQQVLHLSV